MDTFGSCHDTLTACQGCRQASDASRIFTALMKSALADSPHFRHELRLGLAVVCRYLTASSPCYRAGAAGVLRRHGIEKTTPPVGVVLQFDGASSNRLPSKIARLSPDFWATRFSVPLRRIGLRGFCPSQNSVQLQDVSRARILSTVGASDTIDHQREECGF